MNNLNSNFRNLISKYINLAGIDILLVLNDGSKIKLENAIVKQNEIFNHYYDRSDKKPINFSQIAYAELCAA